MGCSAVKLRTLDGVCGNRTRLACSSSRASSTVLGPKRSAKKTDNACCIISHILSYVKETIGICFKSLQGRHTLIVHQNNGLNLCSLVVMSMRPCSQTNPSVYNVDLQVAGEGEVFFQVQNRIVSHIGLLQFSKFQGSMACNLLESLTRDEQNDIPRSVGRFILHSTVEIDNLVSLNNISNASLTTTTSPVLPSGVVRLKPPEFFNILQTRHNKLRRSFMSQKIADIGDYFNSSLCEINPMTTALNEPLLNKILHTFINLG